MHRLSSMRTGAFFPATCCSCSCSCRSPRLAAPRRRRRSTRRTRCWSPADGARDPLALPVGRIEGTFRSAVARAPVRPEAAAKPCPGTGPGVRPQERPHVCVHRPDPACGPPQGQAKPRPGRPALEGEAHDPPGPGRGTALRHSPARRHGAAARIESMGRGAVGLAKPPVPAARAGRGALGPPLAAPPPVAEPPLRSG